MPTRFVADSGIALWFSMAFVGCGWAVWCWSVVDWWWSNSAGSLESSAVNTGWRGLILTQRETRYLQLIVNICPNTNIKQNWLPSDVPQRRPVHRGTPTDRIAWFPSPPPSPPFLGSTHHVTLHNRAPPSDICVFRLALLVFINLTHGWDSLW